MTKQSRFTRRDFLKGGLAVSGALAVGGLGYQRINRSIQRNFQPERSQLYLDSINPPENLNDLPNIVLIITDDLGFGDLGVYGNQAFSTPKIDQMAAEGTHLTNFYATAPLCSPSRAGLFSGRYPVRTMVTSALYPSGSLMNPLLDIVGYYSNGIRGIPEDEVLISEILQKRGYKTGLVGKWHLGDHTPHLPNERGFDEFYGALYSNDMDNYEIYRNDHIELEHPIDQNEITKLMTTEAIKFITTNAAHPFFLTLAHPMPHEPMHASDEFRGQSSAGIYGDSVEEIDWSVGEILRAIREIGQDEKTIVIFTSDNGPWWQGNPGFTRGRKILPFEGGFRVPFIARWPGTIPKGVSCESLSMNFDLFATCLDISGVHPPNDRVIDGKTILPLLKGDTESTHTTLFFFRAKTLMGVRHNNWKYLRRGVTDNGGYWPLSQGPFLFNLENDPNESYSMIETEPKIALLLSGMLDNFESLIEDNLRGWL